jgi:hypothetical protein
VFGRHSHTGAIGNEAACLDADRRTRQDAPMTDDPLARAAALAQTFLAGAAARPVGIPVDRNALRARLGGPLPEQGEDPAGILERLAEAADPGIVGTAGRAISGSSSGARCRRRSARTG